MPRCLAALLALLLVVAACASHRPAPPSGFGAGTTGHTVAFGGLERTYRLYVPADLAPAAPLVVMLHGGFGSAEQAEGAYGWDRMADTAQFAVVYPEGVGRAWNGGTCCGRPVQDGVDDVGFISEVIADVEANVGIDRRRIYATGMSNGGLMSYALACSTDIFAAFGPVAATLMTACPTPRATSVMHIHGRDDRMVRYDGGPGSGVARIDGPSVPEVNVFWRDVARCAPPSITVDGPVTTSAAACPDNRAVTLITVDGGGHEWPSFATTALWQFFSARSR